MDVSSYQKLAHDAGRLNGDLDHETTYGQSRLLPDGNLLLSLMGYVQRVSSGVELSGENQGVPGSPGPPKRVSLT